MKNIRNVKRQDLIRIGLDPKLFPPERLFYWLIKPRNPVLASDDPLARMFIEGMLKNEPVGFIYLGGSKPGSPRKVNVSLAFQLEEQGEGLRRWILPRTRRQSGLCPGFSHGFMCLELKARRPDHRQPTQHQNNQAGWCDIGW
jgi:hypothetical protein